MKTSIFSCRRNADGDSADVTSLGRSFLFVAWQPEKSVCSDVYWVSYLSVVRITADVEIKFRSHFQSSTFFDLMQTCCTKCCQTRCKYILVRNFINYRWNALKETDWLNGQIGGSFLLAFGTCIPPYTCDIYQIARFVRRNFSTKSVIVLFVYCIERTVAMSSNLFFLISTQINSIIRSVE